MACLSTTGELYSYMVASVLSFTGSLFVILIISKTRLYCWYSFHILLLISINDLLRGLLGIVLTYFKKNPEFCAASAYLLYSLSLSNYVWAACITFTIYQIVVNEETDFIKHHKKWLLSAYAVPLTIYLLPFITWSYGLNENYCELKFDLPGSIWRFSIDYFPMMLILFLIVLMSIRIYKKMKILEGCSVNSIVFERGLIYTIIISVFEIPLFVLRVVQLFTDDCALAYIMTGLTFLYLLQGFCNAVVFFLNKTVRQILKIRKENIHDDEFLTASLALSYRSSFS